MVLGLASWKNACWHVGGFAFDPALEKEEEPEFHIQDTD